MNVIRQAAIYRQSRYNNGGGRKETTRKMVVSIHVCPVLNFLQRNITKEKDIVIKIASKFFSKDAIKQAQDVCKSALKLEVLEGRRGSHPSVIFLADFHDLLSGFLARKEELPLFVIVDPCDVPAIPNEPNTIVASRLNECVKMLDFFVEKQETSMQPTGPEIWPSVPA